MAAKKTPYTLTGMGIKAVDLNVPIWVVGDKECYRPCRSWFFALFQLKCGEDEWWDLVAENMKLTNYKFLCQAKETTAVGSECIIGYVEFDNVKTLSTVHRVLFNGVLPGNIILVPRNSESCGRERALEWVKGGGKYNEGKYVKPVNEVYVEYGKLLYPGAGGKPRLGKLKKEALLQEAKDRQFEGGMVLCGGSKFDPLSVGLCAAMSSVTIGPKEAATTEPVSGFAELPPMPLARFAPVKEGGSVPTYHVPTFAYTWSP